MQTQRRGSEAKRFHYEYRPTVFDPFESGAGGFLEFLLPLHREFTPRQRHLIAKRERAAY